MTGDTTRYRFGSFRLDPANRRLLDGERPVELNTRYLDALTLLVREPGQLVTKDRFLDEVWKGVPVTDEALTQCIKTLRRQLGDDALRPRFIETVPKHGYRFIAAVEPATADPGVGQAARAETARTPTADALLLAVAGMVGGGLAGIVGGLIYGFAGASQPLEPGIGAASVLLVLVCLTELVALMGAAGVAAGIAGAQRLAGRSSPWTIAGAALGGAAVGGVVKLLGIDAFHLLFGQSPGDITGGLEGAIIGGAVGTGAWLAMRAGEPVRLRRAAGLAAVAGAAGGLLVIAAGGRMMIGSLDLLAHSFPGSRLRIEAMGAMFGEAGLGPVTTFVTAALEGGLFAACVVGAMVIARRNLGAAPSAELPLKPSLRRA